MNATSRETSRDSALRSEDSSAKRRSSEAPAAGLGRGVNSGGSAGAAMTASLQSTKRYLTSVHSAGNPSRQVIFLPSA